MNYLDLVRRVIRDNSGGAEFSTLLVELIPLLPPEHRDSFNPEMLEKQIRESSDLRILDYGWDMGGLIREKMFVYTPLPD